MFARLARHRKFEYTPRVYNPKKEEREGKPKIEFRSMRHRRQTKPFIWLFILLFFVAYLIILLSKIANNF